MGMVASGSSSACWSVLMALGAERGEGQRGGGVGEWHYLDILYHYVHMLANK